MTQIKPHLYFFQASLFCLITLLSFQGSAANSNRQKDNGTPTQQGSPATSSDTGAAPAIAIRNSQYGPVKPGDNLYQIARTANPSGTKRTLKETMQAIFEANPHAFLGSMAQIKLGATLTIPDFSEETPIENAKKTQTSSPVIDSIALPSRETNSSSGGDVPTFVDQSTERKAQPETSNSTQESTAKQEEVPPELPSEADENHELPSEFNEIEATEDNGQIGSPKTFIDKEPSGKPLDVTPLADSDDEPASHQESPLENAIPNTSKPNSEIPQRQAFGRATTNELGDLRSQLADARQELDRLVSERDSSTAINQTSISRVGTSLSQSPLFQWLPWVLIALMLPLMLYLLLKRNRETVLPIPDPNEEYPDFEADIITPTPSTNEFESPTLTGEENITRPGDTLEITTNPEYEVDSDHANLLDSSNIKPSGLNTLQSSPELTTRNPTQTLECNEDRPPKADASLDLAQEAELHLAYEQYSEAERNINQLLKSDPQNDRNRLLQLKLFAETARINELKALSEELLQKHPDEQSDIHKQIQSIRETSMSQYGNRATTQQIPMAVEEDGPIMAEPEKGEKAPAAEELASEATYSDDISDYLSDNTLSDIDGLSVDTMSIEYEDFAHALLDDNAPLEDLTEQEMDAISAEMELMDEPDQLIIERNELTSNKNYTEPGVLSDTDPHYRPAGERTLELCVENEPSEQFPSNVSNPFDLDAKLHNTTPGDQSSKDKDSS
jgi:hypothetical protein